MDNAIIVARLTALVAIWEDVTEHPERIIFTRTLVHDVLRLDAMLADLLPNQKSPNKHQKDTITYLHAALTRRDTATRVLEMYCPTALADLARATKQSPDTYDVPALRTALTALLHAVDQPAYLAHLGQALADTCLSPAADVQERLATLVQMFLERAIMLLSAKRLHSYCADVLASSLLRLRHDIIAQAIQHRDVTHAFDALLTALRAQFPAFVQAHTRADDRAPEVRAADLAHHLLVTDKDAARRFEVFFVRTMFDGVTVPSALCQQLFDAATQEPRAQQRLIARMSRDPFWQTLGQAWFQRFAAEAVLALSAFYLYRTLPTEDDTPTEGWVHAYHETPTVARDRWHQYGAKFEEHLLATGLFHDVTRPWPPDWPAMGCTPHYPAVEVLRRLPMNNIHFNLALDLSTSCRVNIAAPHQRALVQQFIRTMMQELLVYVRVARNTGAISEAQRDAFAVAPVLDLRDAQQRISAGLQVWLAALAKQFLTSVQFIGSARANAFLIGNPAPIATAFAEQMQRRVTQTMKGSHVHHVLPSVRPDDVAHLMYDLSAHLHDDNESYRVIGIVDGLDLASKSLQLGTVRIYDARTWEYGESSALDHVVPATYRGVAERYAPTDWTTLEQIVGGARTQTAPTEQVRDHYVRHSARAMVVVDAADETMARDKAAIEMQGVLDIVTFAHTERREGRSNVRLSLLPAFAVVTPTNIRTFIGGDTLREGILTSDTSSFTNLVASYHTFLNRPSTTYTPLELSVIRAIHWLARGQWETYLPDRLLNYWIAIEQLLVLPAEKNKGEGVRNRLSKLVAPWYANGPGQAVLKQWRELVQEIKRHPLVCEQLDADIAFALWRTSASVLLGRIDQLMILDTARTFQAPQSLKQLMDRDRIVQLHDQRQADVAYRTELIYAQRNKIVHEGSTYRTDLKWYTAALWDDAETAVDRVLERVIALPGHFMSIDDVIAAHAIPF